MRRLLLLYCLISTLPLGLGAAIAGNSPALARWPLDLPNRYLTSSFMEHRTGRYHAGLDLKTQSRLGFAVHAAEKGCIVRLRATARAYGRAVYLQTPSGKTYVYAHLSRFADDLREKVQTAQRVSGTYRTELYFKPGELCVERGEILGLTGQSGTGGPHLHFEVRDGAQHPVNPLAEGFAVPDTFPPVIFALHAVPMTAAATVAGHTAIMTTGRPDQVSLPDTLESLDINGPVAFTARVVDFGDVRGHRLEPWLFAVFLDGELVYHAENSTFGFELGSRERLEWYSGFVPRERWLFKRAGVDVPEREGAPWPWGPSGQGLSPGAHELRIFAQDYAGGESSVVLPLFVGRSDPGGAPAWRPAPLNGLADSLGAIPAGCRLNPFFSDGLPEAGYTEITLSPGHEDPVLQAMALWTRPWLIPGNALVQALAQHLEPTPWATEFLAGDWLMESAIPVGLSSVGGTPTAPTVAQRRVARVYKWNGKHWSGAQAVIFKALKSGSRDSLSFGLTSPGQYAVFYDQTGPRFKSSQPAGTPLVVGPGPAQKWATVTPPRWEVLPVGITDDGSGVDPSSLKVTLDGRALVVEPDLPRQRILVELPNGTIPGPHVLQVTLDDMCGNSSSLTQALMCQPRKEKN